MQNVRQILLSSMTALLLSQVEAAQPCPAGPLAAVANLLKNYPPAEAYCALRFPVPTETHTVHEPEKTITKTVSTETVTVNRGTVTTVVTALARTVTTYLPFTTTTKMRTTTETSTETDFITDFISTASLTITAVPSVTVGIPVKRDAFAEAYPAVENTDQADIAMAFQELQSRPLRAICTVCRCMQVAPPAVTKTEHAKTIIRSVTATVTDGAEKTITRTTHPAPFTVSVTPVTFVTSTLTDFIFTTTTVTVDAITTLTITVPAPTSTD